MSWTSDEEAEDLCLIDELERQALLKRQPAQLTSLCTGPPGPVPPRPPQPVATPAWEPVGPQQASGLRPAAPLAPQQACTPAAPRAGVHAHGCGTQGTAAPQCRQALRPALPPELVSLRQCVDRFRALSRSLPPPKSAHDRCPGVFNRGCGGQLAWVQGPLDASGRPSFGFWRCSRYHSADSCHYREYPPPRRTTPELGIQVRWPDAVEVAPLPGADEVTAACGGVAAVLSAAGVDLRRALHQGDNGTASGATAVCKLSDAMPAALVAGAMSAGHMAPDMPAKPATGAELSVLPQACAPSTTTGESSMAVANTLTEEAEASTRGTFPAGTTSTAPKELDVQAARGGQPQGEQADAAMLPCGNAGSGDREPGATSTDAPNTRQSVQRPGRQGATNQAVAFSLEDYESLKTTLLRAGSLVGLTLLSSAGTIPPKVLLAVRGKLRPRAPEAEVEARYGCMPPWLEGALLPFQREGVRYGLAHGGRLLLADEMGVGKTVQALALASCYAEEWPLLVVAPASVRLMWAEECERWLPHLRPSALHVIEGHAGRVRADARPLVTIISYEMHQRLTCDACKGRAQQVAAGKSAPGGPHQRSAAAGPPRPRPPCKDPFNCMAGMGWKVIIVDESHVLRTSSHEPDALHTEAVVTTAKRAARAIFLSGTPSLSRPFDLYRQVDALYPGLLGPDRTAFASTYCARHLVPCFGGPGSTGGGQRWNNSGLSRAGELHGLLKDLVMLRRLKRDVLAQLPPKRRQVIRLPKPPPADWPSRPRGNTRGANHGSKDRGGRATAPAAEDEEDEEGEGEEEGEGGAGSDYMTAVHRTGLAKLNSVVDWLMNALGRSRGSGGTDAGQQDNGSGGSAEHGPKLLVFAHHKSVMAGLAAALEGTTGYSRVPYVRIDGSSDSADRQLAVSLFREDPCVRVALLSVTAAGVGLDFSTASAVVFAELPSEVSLVRQAEDRAHRRGQRHPVNVYFLCAKGTTDDRCWQALNRSLARVSAVHDGVAGEPSAGGSDAAEGVGGGSQAGLVVARVCDMELEGGGMHGEDAQRMTNLQAAEHAQQDQQPTESQKQQEQQQQQQQVAEEAIELEPTQQVEEFDQEQPAAGEAPTADTAGAAGTTAMDASSAADSKPGPTSAATSGNQSTTNASAVETSSAVPGAGAGKVQQRQHTAVGRQQLMMQGRLREVWFEVSRHTGRVHFHGAQDGSQLLRLSLAQDTLVVEGSPTLQELLVAVEGLQTAAAMRAAGGAQPAAGEPPPKAGTVVPGVGLVALPPSVCSMTLSVWLAEAREFASEWRELRGIHQSRLAGRVLRAPLDAEVEAAQAAAAAAGALGQGTNRFVDAERADLALPPGATWRSVRVRFSRWAHEATHQQPFAPGGQRLCLNCAAPVPGAEAVAAEAVLEGTFHLFCGGPCEHHFGLKSNGSAYRRALFALERGRCVLCGLDCHALVKKLQTVERGTAQWEQRRRMLVAHEAPRFLARGYAAQLEALVKRAVPGNAWHADHIRPVYQGGGLCDVDNLRTLCTLCHKDVTVQQSKERAAERKALQAAAADKEEWLQPGAAGGALKLLRRPRRTKRLFLDDDKEGTD